MVASPMTYELEGRQYLLIPVQESALCFFVARKNCKPRHE